MHTFLCCELFTFKAHAGDVHLKGGGKNKVSLISLNMHCWDIKAHFAECQPELSHQFDIHRNVVITV